MIGSSALEESQAGAQKHKHIHGNYPTVAKFTLNMLETCNFVGL